jgi:hypothetical protein
MRADLIFFVLLSGFGFLRFGPFVQRSPHAVDMWGPWIWTGFCAVIFLLYPLIQTSELRSQVARFFALFGRSLVVFLLSAALWTLAIIWLYPINKDEWPLGAYLVISSALLVALPAFSLGYIARRYFTRAA